jgi:FkbM family methyltransferase
VTLGLGKKGRKLARIICACNLQWFRAVLFGVAAGIEHWHVLPNLDTLWTVVDVGANHGQFALIVRHCFSEANVFSFEPLSRAAVVFRKVFRGDPKVTLHQSAIGPETGEATIHVATADDSSSLLAISAMQERLFPETGEIRTATVKVGRLSSSVSAEEIVAPAMLKLDVQGYELEALRGCEDLLARFSYVYAECSFVELYEGQALVDEIIAWLREWGFRLSGVYHMGYDQNGRAVQRDFLFISTRGC